ncbi:MAG: kynureninase [Candidatus Neomarinimicrobiota bacterium]|nr:kynureninase [Candidatus Neomarinimicrobiota bacterium]
MTFENSRSCAQTMDQVDPLGSYQDKFHYPKNDSKENIIYFSGNSLGIQPKSVRKYVETELNVWEKEGLLGQYSRWENFHERLIENTARLVGAQPSEVVVMNALTVNIHLLLVSFYQPNENRKKIILEQGTFPSDQYAIKSQIKFHGFDPQDTLIELSPRKGETTLRTKDILAAVKDVNEELATVILGGVNYYTGQAFDMQSITKAGHKVGAFVGFDLAHGAGNLELNLHNWGVDFAAWCSYKYLCAGPGSPAGIFIHKTHHDWTGPRFTGWWGHNKNTRFEMGPDFDPIQTAEGWQISNAPVMGMAPLLAAMEIFDEAGMAAIRLKSEKLTGFLEYLIAENLPDVAIITPVNPAERGCQLSLVVPGGKNTFKKILKKGVVCDWRKPDVIRVAPHPLFNRYTEVYDFVELLEQSLSE